MTHCQVHTAATCLPHWQTSPVWGNLLYLPLLTGKPQSEQHGHHTDITGIMAEFSNSDLGEEDIGCGTPFLGGKSPCLHEQLSSSITAPPSQPQPQLELDCTSQELSMPQMLCTLVTCRSWVHCTDSLNTRFYWKTIFTLFTDLLWYYNHLKTKLILFLLPNNLHCCLHFQVVAVFTVHGLLCI